MPRLFSIWILVSLSALAAAEACNEPEGTQLAEQENYGAAFSLLVECEFEEDFEGKTLMYLSTLYLLGFGEFESIKSRGNKALKLEQRAAIKGNEDALTGMVSLYRYGDTLLEVEPDSIKAACLSEAGVSDSLEIERCLGE